MTRRLRDRLVYFTRRQGQPGFWPEFWPACWRGTFWLCLLAGSAAAQAQYRFDNWTTHNGLPQNSVDAITQTRDGYLWFTTRDGLVRYDGVRFTIFDKSNTKGMTTNRCYSLFEDAEGTLWIGTEEGGLIRYRDGAFAAFTMADGLPDDWVQQIQTDTNGNLLVTTKSGIAQWRDGRFIPFTQQGLINKPKVYLGRSGARWEWDQAGLHRGKDGQESTYKITLEQSKPTHPILYETRNGDLWGKQGLQALFRISNGAIIRYTEKDGLPANIENFWAILEDRHGNLWFGTNKAGLLRYKDGRFTVYTTANGLSSNDIRSIFEDREGTLWIGANERGLNRLTQQFITTLSTEDGLIGDNLYPIYEDRAGQIWLGTFSGLSRFSAGRFTNYNRANGLSYIGVQAIASDRAGRLWIGTLGGLFSFADGRFTLRSDLMPQMAVQVIQEDGAGNIWVGTERGLLRFKDDNKTFYTTRDGLPGNDVKAILEDRQGALWIGTYGGLAQFKDGRFVAYTTKDGLASDRVRALYQDSDGVLWIGTYDGGLSRFKDGRFTNYTMENGLFNNGVFQILEDRRGNFWISCNRGVYRAGKQQLNDFAAGKIPAINCIAYGLQDGLLNTECNGGRQPAGMKARDGKLWFPTQKGAIIIDPEAVPFNPQPPPVLIEKVTIDRASAAFSAGGVGVRVLPGQANLEINYTGLSYTKPEQVRFKYKLTGQDADWIEAGTRRAANYSYLPPGAYTFTVIAANSDGVWNNEGAQLRVVVVPAFYQTWWFRLLALLAIAGVTGLAFKRRLDQAHHARQVQEDFSRRLIDSQEQERKRIAAELHDSLGQNLLIIKNHALLGLAEREDPAATEENLTTISEMTSQVLDEARQIAYNLRPYQIDRFGLTKAIQAMLNRVADASEIAFHCQVDSLDGIFSKEAEMNLYRIVQESINNILKHSHATEAEIKITRAEDRVLLRVSDNGQGFALDAGADAAKRGFGLTGIAERARMLGGQYRLQSTPGQGAVINIEIDLKESVQYR
ncbi:MAG: ligand-binding sensor domain-containing protein [Blastocatellia bacterium]